MQKIILIQLSFLFVMFPDLAVHADQRDNCSELGFQSRVAFFKNTIVQMQNSNDYANTSSRTMENSASHVKGRDCFTDFLEYWLIKREIFQNSNTINTAEVRVSQLNDTLLPEGLIALLEEKWKDSDKGQLYTKCLSELLPVSSWSLKISAYGVDVLELVDPAADFAPLLNGRIMLKIANNFEQAEEWDLAWRAYVEAISCEFVVPFSWNKRRSWHSCEAAEYWLKVAECAYKANNKNRAENYLCKAAFWGDEAISNKVDKLFCDLLNNVGTNQNATDQSVSIEKKRGFLMKAVHLYTEINAHPRALQLLDDFKKMLPDEKELRKKIENEWSEIAKNSSRGLSKGILYGVEVYPAKNDPLKIKIPWALSDVAVESVRKRLREAGATNRKQE